jgi:iron(III) transport system substrate-binding protein
MWKTLNRFSRNIQGDTEMFKKLALSLTLFSLTYNVTGGIAGDAEHLRLVEEAKKEARMVFYTSVSTEYASALTRGFEQKYPFIKTDIFRSGHEKILSRLNVEQKTGRFTADVVSVGEFETYHLKKMGLTAPYKSASADAFPEGFKDAEGYWTDLYDNLIVVAYNTTKVKREEAPKRYEDLLKPSWKGRMALDTHDERWFANMLHLIGEENGMALMQGLAAQEVQMRRGRTLITQLLLAGEFDLQITAYWYRAHLLKKSGAPVDWVAVDPVIVALHPISLVNHAPHPNAAKLFIDYVLSEEGQRAFSQKGRVAARPGVKPEGFPAHLRLAPSRVELAEKLEDYRKRFDSLFVR